MLGMRRYALALLATLVALLASPAAPLEGPEPAPEPIVVCRVDNWYAQTEPCKRMCAGGRVTHVLQIILVDEPEPHLQWAPFTCAEYLAETREASYTDGR